MHQIIIIIDTSNDYNLIIDGNRIKKVDFKKINIVNNTNKKTCWKSIIIKKQRL